MTRVYIDKKVIRFSKRQGDFIRSLYDPEEDTFSGTVRRIIDFTEFLFTMPLWKVLKPMDTVRAELLEDFEHNKGIINDF